MRRCAARAEDFITYRPVDEVARARNRASFQSADRIEYLMKSTKPFWASNAHCCGLRKKCSSLEIGTLANLLLQGAELYVRICQLTVQHQRQK
jgi:hypothetical protein